MFTYTKVENLKWVSNEQTAIDCEVYFDKIPGATSFTVNPVDLSAHTQELWTRALAGDFGHILDYVPSSIAPTQSTSEIQITEIL